MEKERYDDKFVKCPFFISEDKTAIKCEGIICYRAALIFENAERKRQYMSNYCKRKYTECRHYRGVAGKYGK